VDLICSVSHIHSGQNFHCHSVTHRVSKHVSYSMGIAGYVSVCVLLYCMLVFHCLSLHGHLKVCRILHIFIFICLRILLRCLFLRGHTLHVSHLCFDPVLFSFCVFWCLVQKDKFLGSRTLSVRRAHNFTAIYEPIV
jgi:hypothetical protein